VILVHKILVTRYGRLVIPNNYILWPKDCVPEAVAIDTCLWSVTN